MYGSGNWTGTAGPQAKLSTAESGESTLPGSLTCSEPGS
jgi:hypothetical protein